MRPDEITDEMLRFLQERHLATLTTFRRDGSPHVSPVGVTWDPTAGLARVITWTASQKARNVARQAGQDPEASAARAAVCQVDGGRWLTLEGPATLVTDPDRCRDAERRYAERYTEPKARDDRAVIEIRVDRVMGRA